MSLPSSRPLHSFPSHLKKNPHLFQVVELPLHAWPLASRPASALPSQSLHSRHFSLLEHIKLFHLKLLHCLFILPEWLFSKISSNDSWFTSCKFCCTNVHSTKRPGFTIPSNILLSHNPLLQLHCLYQSPKLLLKRALLIICLSH